MKTQLLCTFTTKEKLQTTLQEIRETYHIVYNYIYVLQNKSDLDELFVTYNIDTAFKPDKPLDILNLNELVKEENNGVLDKSFAIDWEKFKNSIIVTNVEGTKKINTRVFDVIKFS